MQAAQIWHLFWQSLLRPTEVARQLISFDPGRPALWMALALVTILSVLTMALLPGVQAVNPVTGGAMTATPYLSVLLLGVLLAMTVFALYFTGQALGGRGTFAATLLVVIWIEALASGLRILDVAAALLLGPQLGGLLSILMLAALVWALVNFINVLHGFANLGRAVAVLVLALVGIIGGLAVILTLIAALAARGA